jgi:hypothetical protein
LDLLKDGFKASTAKLMQLEVSNSNSSISKNQNTAIPLLPMVEDTAFSTWINYHYRWALKHCEMRNDEDFIYLVKMGAILGLQSLMDE